MKLRIGSKTLDADAGRDAIAAAIAESNRHTGIPDLPDEFNYRATDPAKALALLDALPNLPADTRKRLEGRTLDLTGGGLMIASSLPTTPASFAQPFPLELADAPGDLVSGRAQVPVDCALARRRAAAARARTEQENRGAAALDAKRVAVVGSAKEHDALVALSDARTRRSSAAEVWRANAEALTRCQPDDQAAKADLAAAEHAVRAYLTGPVGGGMPN